MHLADDFIQSDLHCIQVTVLHFYQLLFSLGIKPMILALLAPCSTIWATGKHYYSLLVEMLLLNTAERRTDAGVHTHLNISLSLSLSLSNNCIGFH